VCHGLQALEAAEAAALAATAHSWHNFCSPLMMLESRRPAELEAGLRAAINEGHAVGLAKDASLEPCATSTERGATRAGLSVTGDRDDETKRGTRHD
jgi:hypothetical protein